MSRPRALTALALATALLSAVPATAHPAARRATVQAAAPRLLDPALAWLAARWGGAPERAAAGRDDSGGGIDPNGARRTLATAGRPPLRLPSGGGIDPNG